MMIDNLKLYLFFTTTKNDVVYSYGIAKSSEPFSDILFLLVKHREEDNSVNEQYVSKTLLTSHLKNGEIAFSIYDVPEKVELDGNSCQLRNAEGHIVLETMIEGEFSQTWVDGYREEDLPF